MASVSVHIDISNANLFLGGLGGNAANAISNGIEKVAMYLRDKMTTYSQGGHPDHPNVITGRLSGSMRYQMTGTATAEVGSDVNYAPYVEFGHMSPNWGNAAKGWHFVPAYPWFRPAITDVQGGEGQAVFNGAVAESLI